MWAWEVVGAALLVAGTVFLAVTAVGLHRFPDFFSRAHAVSKAESLGLLLTFGGLLAINRLGAASPQLVVILVIAVLVNPTAVHALARSARARSAAAAGRAAGGASQGTDREVEP